MTMTKITLATALCATLLACARVNAFLPDDPDLPGVGGDGDQPQGPPPTDQWGSTFPVPVFNGGGNQQQPEPTEPASTPPSPVYNDGGQQPEPTDSTVPSPVYGGGGDNGDGNTQPTEPPSTPPSPVYGDNQQPTTTIIVIDGPEYQASTTAKPSPCAPAACQTCDTVASKCVQCKNKLYLLDGACVGACPSQTHVGQGTGNYNRVCLAKPTTAAPLPAFCARPYCAKCAADASACMQCGKAWYLWQGECVQTCPVDTVPKGTGQYGRRCVEAPTTPVPCPTACSKCTGTTCTACKAGQYLHGGACFTTCPPRFLPRIGICESPCTFRRNCAQCTPAGTPAACVKCSHSKYLSDGVCVNTCPDGTTPRGTGRYKRICVV